MSRLPYLFLLFLTPLPAVAQPAGRYAEAIRALDALCERERRDSGIPGLSVALVDDQTTVWAKGFGHADLARTKPAGPDTVFRVGSVSKLFTGIAAMRLVEEGKLDIDAPVTRYLPDFKPDNPFGKLVTLRHLMSHRSGLMREPPAGSYFGPEPPSLAKTVASLNGRPLIYEPGRRIKYSNAGVATVGRVVEKVDGRPFAEAVRARVLGRLGMASTDFEPTPAIQKNLADGLMWTYHGREFPAPKFELGEAPAACLYSTANDLARFMTVLFAGGKTATASLVKPATLKEMQTIQFAPAEASRGFGLGFHVDTLDGRRRVGHSGAMYGFCADVAFLPDEKLGVVVLTNKDITDWVTVRLANAALRHLVAAREGKPLPAVAEPRPVSRELARKLAGRYGERNGHELIEAGGKLYHLGPGGGYVTEVWQVGNDLITHGALGSGERFTCDGTMLTWGVPGGPAFPRAKDPTGPPPEPAAHFRGLIGEYGWDHNTLFVFEKDSRLYALIEWFFIYPLDEESPDVFRFPAEGGLYHGEKLVFRRGPGGKATAVEAAGVLFQRRALEGEDGRTFRIKPQKPVEELRRLAAAATPPPEKGEFRKPDLVELTALDGTIKTDLRYATDNNFMGVALYPPTAKAYMQRPAAEALVRVHKALAPKGYGLWVFDSYRPWGVTKMFWDATPEALRTFVADPSKGSRHNRGCAVDVTLYELKTGKPVEMVAGFDEFADRAYPNYWGGTSRQRWHRELLRRAMEDGGFSVYEAEWWHFDFKDWRSYPIGNQTFEELTQRRKDAKEDRRRP